MTAPAKVRGHGRLYTRNGHFWIAYYHRGQQLRESVAKVTGKNTRAAAAALLRQRTRTAGTAAFITPVNERLPIEALLDLVVADYRRREFRSVADVERHVRRLGEYFAGQRAAQVTTAALNAYVDHRRAEGAAAASVNRELSVVGRAFRLAVRQQLLAANQCPQIERLPEANARQGFIDPADFHALLQHMPAWLSDAATFAYLTGWRKREVTTLTWADVTLGADGSGTIRLPAARSKNKQARTVVVTGALVELLGRRAAVRQLDCPFVFHRDGRRLADFRDTWHRVVRAAGHPQLLFHDLRRSAVRNMIRAGVPQAIAMESSGHRSLLVFKRYNIVNEDDLAAAFGAVDRYVAERQHDTPTVVPLRPGRKA